MHRTLRAIEEGHAKNVDNVQYALASYSHMSLASSTHGICIFSDMRPPYGTAKTVGLVFGPIASARCFAGCTMRGVGLPFGLSPSKAIDQRAPGHTGTHTPLPPTAPAAADPSED